MIYKISCYYRLCILATLVLVFALVPFFTHAANISTYSYSGDSFSYTSQASIVLALSFSSDGVYMYLSDTYSGSTVYQYTLSTPWDITTASYTRSKVIPHTGITGLAFSGDGAKMYSFYFYSRVIYEYGLSTPWDISTASMTDTLGSVSIGNNYAFTVKNDGTSLYTVRSSGTYTIYQYTMTSVWDLTTADTTADATLTLTPSDGYYITGITFSSDGSKMYLLRRTSDGLNSSIRQFSLTTPWNVSTATFDTDQELAVDGQSESMSGLAMRSSNGDIYIAGVSVGAKKVFRYVSNDANPTVAIYSPSNNATGISTTADLVLTFNEAVDAEAGADNDIIIKKTSDNSTVETIDAQDVKVSGSGSNAITINPAVTLDEQTNYYVQIGVDAFDDATSNSYAGISDTTTWSFTTGDFTAPTITSISSDKANGSYKEGEIVDVDIIFSETITSTGDVTATLETGDIDRTCTFTVTNSTTGTCNYTVQAGDTSSDLEATITGTIVDQSSNAMISFTPATSLATNKALIIDTTAPSTSIASPAAGTYSEVQSVTLSSAGSSAIYYTTNGDTPTISSTLYSSAIAVNSSQTIKAMSVDVAGNESSVLSATYVINLDSNAPVLSNIIAYTSPTGAIITWNTNEDSSALLNYGLTSSCSSVTSESDTSPRDTDHSTTISDLVSCTRYYYKAQSVDGYTNQGYSSVGTFKTTGCTGDSTIIATGQDTITTAAGGSLSQGNISLTIPISFTISAESAIFQANKLDNTSFIAIAGTPSEYTQLGTDIYALKALSDVNTSISTFAQPITVVLTYSSGDVGTLDESTLWIYRYDGSTWHSLNNCAVNTSAKTVTCTTQSFSDFGIFGQQGTCSTVEHAVTYNAYPTCGPATCSAGYTLSNNACVSSGGGALPFSARKLPIIPIDGFQIIINDGATTTQSRNAILTFNAGSDIKRMSISMTEDFSDASQEDYSQTKQIDLCPRFMGIIHSPTCPDGQYTIYVKFYTQWGVASNIISQKVNFINTSNILSQILSAVFTKNFYFGIRSEDVRRLQQLLSTKPEIYPEGLVTGYFGTLTKKAVQKFQLTYNVLRFKSDPGYGFVGPKTRAKLIDVFKK